MKSLPASLSLAVLLLVTWMFPGVAAAQDVTLTGVNSFSSLDGSAEDHDGSVNGVFTVDGDLVLDGIIQCNDDLPLPGSASACPIAITVSGGLTLEPGSAISAENRRGAGSGGNITLDV